MDPALICCPNLACPARGHTGQGNMRIHSRQDRRFLCTVCHKTFSATKGTAFYRLRTSAETVSLVVTLMAHGCPLQAIVVAFGYDERTVAGWRGRAGVHGQAVQEHGVEQPRDLGQVQADEIRVKTPQGLVWMALAMIVSTRLWLAGAVRAGRTMTRMASLTRRCRALARRTLTLRHGRYLIGTVYHVCTPHASLRDAGGGTTPAMAAGITGHGWTVRALLSFHVPPPGGHQPHGAGGPHVQCNVLWRDGVHNHG